MLQTQNQPILIDSKRMFWVAILDTISNKPVYVMVWVYSYEIVSFIKLRSELHNLGFRLTRYLKNGRDQSPPQSNILSPWITVDPGSYALFPTSKADSHVLQLQHVIEILKKHKVPVTFSKHQQDYLDATSLTDAPTQVLVTYVPPYALPFFFYDNILQTLLFSIVSNDFNLAKQL